MPSELYKLRVQYLCAECSFELAKCTVHRVSLAFYDISQIFRHHLDVSSFNKFKSSLQLRFPV